MKKKSNRKGAAEAIRDSIIDYAVVKRRLGVTPEVHISKEYRVDLMGICFSAYTEGFEIKSGWADYSVDKKWMNYVPHFNKFYLCFHESIYKTHGKELQATCKQYGVGLILLSATSGYAYVKHRAKFRGYTGDLKQRLYQAAKLAWRGSLHNKTNRRRRTRRFIV